MKTLLLNFLVKINLDKIFDLILYKLPFKLKLRRYEIESNQKIMFVNQGGYNLSLLGDLKKFKIDTTSHLKSDTTIECTGGVEIGRYFHSGKGLTIFSANHNWRNSTKIPYDEIFILKKVIIEDFVWLGTNVTILPGVVIGEGAVVAGGSIVVKDVGKCEVVGGNPAKLISKRDLIQFEYLKNKNAFN